MPLTEHNEADERMRIMFDAMPLCANIHNKNFDFFDCNKGAISLFGFSSKQEYIDNFHKLSPEYQPDGSLSSKKSDEYRLKAFDEGYCRFEWMHQKLNGEPILCEVTLVRVKYKDEFVLIAYIRDLRELKQMMEEIEQREKLLNTVNNVANVLLSINNYETFEASLFKSFELVGHCLEVDRVQIWRNEVIENELHFVHRFEWLSDNGLNCKPVPIGLHFPYSKKPEWKNLFLLGKYINAPISVLPEDDQNFLNSYEMKSIVIIPMFLEGNFWGFFSIDDCRRERVFSDDEIRILSSVGLMMSNAVNRNLQTAKMREADERTQVMLDATPLCVNFWNKKLQNIDCNQEAVKLFGLSDKQEYIDRFHELSPEYQPDGRLSSEKGIELVNKTFEEGYYRFEWMHRKLNGEPLPCEITLVRVKFKEDYIVLGYTRDLHEYKAMLADLKLTAKKQADAEAANIAKSAFLAKVSHEIRSPMNAVLGITEIQLQNESLPSDTQEALEKIYNSGYLLLGIINDILDLSKIEAGKLELSQFSYDVASLINDTVQLNIMLFDNKPIKFELQVNENIPSMLIGDELRIKQILNNLLSNAFKYTDSGKVLLSVDMETQQAEIDSITLIFRVSDTGQGMTPEQVSRLFDEYTRFNTEANRMTTGTGLGMSITKHLIKLMNGEIFVDSKPDYGSLFTVRLPQKIISGSGVLGKELVENIGHLHSGKISKMKKMPFIQEYMPYGRVLIVDDVETNLYVARGLMTSYGLSVETAVNAFEVIDKVKNGTTWDIIFMDHFMPIMDGIEATKILRGLGYTQPIVALTANVLTGQAEMFLSNGFNDFISKPIDTRQLNETLNKLVRDKYPIETVNAARQLKGNLRKNNGGLSNALTNPEIAKIFIRDAKKAVGILEAIHANNYRRDSDMQMYIINSHAMKSALANMGETELSAAARKLEDAGRNRNIDIMISETPVFLKSLQALIEKIKSKKDNINVENKNDDNEYLLEKLAVIQKACANYDKKAAKTTLAELQQKTWSRSVGQLLDAIAEHLLHSDFTEAGNLAQNYKENR
ncbi:MAG: response regulator [Treponema sp.]|jgi:signal transduction histidine kinase/CheY-like chemotaxis protein|nr:response regulator [Treponema sp.]